LGKGLLEKFTRPEHTFGQRKNVHATKSLKTISMKNFILLSLILMITTFSFGQTTENARAAQIFSVGLTVGFAEYGAMKGDKPSFLAEKLKYAIENAEATGCIPTARLKELRQKMLNTSDSRSLYKEIEAYRRDELFYQVMEFCSCTIDNSPSTDDTNTTGGANVHLELNKYVFPENENIIVTFSGMTGATTDWIALTAKNKPLTTYDKYLYTGGKKSGSLTFTGLKAGEYEARAYFKDSYKLEAKAGFTVSKDAAGNNTNTSGTDVHLELNKYVFPENENIIVTFSGMTGATTDWIALTAKNKPLTTYDKYLYTGGKKSGSLTFTGLKAGEYEARAYFKDSYKLEAKAGFTVSKDAAGNNTNTSGTDVHLELNKYVFPENENIIVTFSGMTGATTDWIALTAKNKPLTTYDKYLYTGGKKSGFLTFSGLKAGEYEARAYFKDSYKLEAKVGFTVSKDATGNISEIFVQLPPPAIDIKNWKVDYGPYEINGTQIDAKPTGDGKTSYYIASGSFKGNWGNFHYLSFDKMSWGGSYYGPGKYEAYGDVVIKNGYLTARYDITKDHSKQWKSYKIPLNGTGWKLSGGAGSLQDVLDNVTEFRIRAEYGSGTDFSSLRNVVLTN
jgi:Laminin B (Domain IV)